MFRAVSMSVLAPGVIPAEEAIEYVSGLPNVQGIVFGASSKAHGSETRELIVSRWTPAARDEAAQVSDALEELPRGA